MALGEGRDGVSDEFSAGLPARGDRLAQPAVFLAAGQRGIIGFIGHFGLAARGGC